MFDYFKVGPVVRLSLIVLLLLSFGNLQVIANEAGRIWQENPNSNSNNNNIIGSTPSSSITQNNGNSINFNDHASDISASHKAIIFDENPTKGKEENQIVQKDNTREPGLRKSRGGGGRAESRSAFTFADLTTTTPIITVTTRPPIPITTLSSNCTCVPYYYCDEAQVVAGGAGTGVIDISNGWPCHSILQVCCRQPKPIPTTTTPNPAVVTTVPPVTSTAIPGYTPRCGTLNPNGINARILGFKDSETQFGEYPWMAAILEKKYVNGVQVNYFICGASLIWPSVVVTAAHCVKGKKPDHLIIRLGEWDAQTTNEFYAYQDIKGREIVIHPSYYGGALYSDIALIFLDKSAILAPHVDTICLPAASTTNYETTSCWATGWGRNSFAYNGSYQAILKEVELPIVPRTICQDAFRKTDLGSGFILHDSFLCAGGLKGLDTCVGDGGGPLVCASTIDPWRYVLSGITSWGVKCGTYGVPGAYVDVSKFRAWIDTTIITRIPTYDVTRVTVTNQLG